MKRRKDPNKYSVGWDRRRVQRMIDHYDNMSDAKGARETESLPLASPLTGVTWVAVPNKLLPKVRKLLAGRRSA